jgi:peroxiredoxin
MTGLWLVSYIALWVLFLVVAVVLLSVLRNLGVIYESLETTSRKSPFVTQTKLETGKPLPNLTLATRTGDTVELSTFQGTRTAFAVVSPHCSACYDLLKDIAANEVDGLNGSISGSTQWVIISVGDTPDTARLVERACLPGELPILADTANAIAEEWGVATTPTTVIVDKRLHVMEQVVGRKFTANKRQVAGAANT